MLSCAACGHYNAPDSKFCDQCGRRVDNACKSCGFDNLPSQIFCGQCGSQLQEEILPGQPNPGAVKTETSLASQEWQMTHDPAWTDTDGGLPAERVVPKVESPEDRDWAATGAMTDEEKMIQVSEYAVGSLEFLNFNEIRKEVNNDGAVDKFRQSIVQEIQEFIQQEQGLVFSVNNNILFFSFPEATSPIASIQEAIRCGLTIINQEHKLKKTAVRMRIGLDLEKRNKKNPIISTTERTVARSQMLVVSPRIFDIIGDKYFFEPIGPMPIGDKQMLFYSVLPENAPDVSPEAMANAVKLDKPNITISDEPPKSAIRSNPAITEALKKSSLDMMPQNVPIPVATNEDTDPNSASSVDLELMTSIATENLAASQVQDNADNNNDQELSGWAPTGTVPEPQPSDNEALNAILSSAPSSSGWNAPPTDTTPTEPIETISAPNPVMETPLDTPLNITDDTLASASQWGTEPDSAPSVFPEQELPPNWDTPDTSSVANLDATAVTPEAEIEPETSSWDDTVPAMNPDINTGFDNDNTSDYSDWDNSATPTNSDSPTDADTGATFDASQSINVATPSNEPSEATSNVVLPSSEKLNALWKRDAYLLQSNTRTPNVSYQDAVNAVGQHFRDAMQLDPSGESNVLSRKGSFCFLAGLPGIGKSNILHMAREQSDPQGEQALWFWSDLIPIPDSAEIPLSLWARFFQNALGLINEGHPRDYTDSQLKTFLTNAYGDVIPEETYTLLGYLLGSKNPEPIDIDAPDRNNRLSECLFHFFTHLAKTKPVVLVIDDFNHADPASLEILSHLVQNGFCNHNISIVTSLTSDIEPTGKLEEALKKTVSKTWVIKPLSAEEQNLFLSSGPLGDNINLLPPDFLTDLHSLSGGSPLYLEEALRLLHLQELIDVDKNGKFIPSSNSSDMMNVVLPASVDDLIAERLNFVPEDARYVLNAASVLGFVFPITVLQQLCQMNDTDFQAALSVLFQHGLIIPDAASSARFRHQNIIKVVYQSIPSESVMRLHQLVSQTLENDWSNNITVNPSLMAIHGVLGDLNHRAFSAWNLSGVTLYHLGAYTGANIAFINALEALEYGHFSSEQEHTTDHMLLTLATLNIEYQPDLSDYLQDWLIDRHKTTGNLEQLLSCYQLKMASSEMNGDYEQAMVYIDDALALLSNELPETRLPLMTSKAEHLYTLGRLQESLTMIDAELAPLLSKVIGLSDDERLPMELNIQLIKAQILVDQCHPDALELIQSGEQQSRMHHLEGLNLAYHLALCQSYLKKGDYALCDTQADGLLGRIESLENNDWFMTQWGLLAMNYHCQNGDWENADQLVLHVLGKADESADHHANLMAHLYAGYLAGKQGDHLKALKILNHSIEESSNYKFATCALLGWRFLAELELESGNTDSAYDIATNALAIAKKDTINNVGEQILLTILVAKINMASGREKEAGQILESAWPSVVETRCPPYIAWMASTIGSFYHHMAKDALAEKSQKYLTRSIQFHEKARHIWLELGNNFYRKQVEAVIPQATA